MSGQLETSPVRRRVIAVGFLVIVAVAGMLNAVVKRHDLAGAEGAGSAVSVVTMNARASTTAWYCPGPLALGHRGVQSAVSITNVSSRALTAQIDIAYANGADTTTSAPVAAFHENVVALPHSKSPTYGALTVVVNGPGVGVNELMETSEGLTTSPCTTHTSTDAYFGVGSTSGQSNVAVSLYNPGATPAVANLAFITGGAQVTPAAFTSVPVEPGQDVVLFAGHVLPQRRSLSAVVTTVSGELAVGDLNSKDLDNVVDSALTVSSPVAQPSWQFAPTIVSREIHESFSFVNPSSKRVSVDIRLLGVGGTGVTTIDVPADQATQFNVPSPLRPGIEGASVTVNGAGSIVAERETFSSQHISLSGAPLRTSLPAELPPGLTVTSASAAPSTSWLIAGGASSGSSSEVLGVFNTNDVPVTVSISQLYDGAKVALHGARTITVGAHRSASINVDNVLQNRNALAFVLSSSRSVLVGATEYGLTRNGLSAPAPLPIG